MSNTISSVWASPTLMTHDNLENCFSQTGMDTFVTVDSTNHSVTDILGGDLINLHKLTYNDHDVIGFGINNDGRYMNLAVSTYNYYLESIWYTYHVGTNVVMFMFGDNQSFSNKRRIVSISKTNTTGVFVGFECTVNANPNSTNKFVNDQSAITNSIVDTTARSALNNGISDYYVLMPIYIGNKCATNFYTIDCGTSAISAMTPFIISNTTYISPYAKVAIKID
jgi:hypothetical protein